MDFKNRIRMRKKEIKKIEEDIKNYLGIEYKFTSLNVEKIPINEDIALILTDNKVSFIEKGNFYMFSLSNLLENPIYKKYIAVDEGAIIPISDGADVMGKGVADCDESIKENDLVWVMDIKHKRPIAIAYAIKSGNEMKSRPPGKCAILIYHVGDAIWKFETK
ncbi:MAG: PUA domain-containing protein [Thermoplasmata archaeon]